MTDDGDFGSTAGISGDGFDFDDSIVDFGDFLSEEFGHELGVAPREEDLRSAEVVSDFLDVATDSVAWVVSFSWDGFAFAHEGFCVSEFYIDIAVFDSFDESADDLSDSVFVFFVLSGAFGFADMFDDGIFDGSGGDSSHIDGGEEFAVEGADFVEFWIIGFTIFGLILVDFDGVLFDIFDDGVASEESDFT